MGQAVNDVDSIIGGVGDVHTSRTPVDSRVIEAPGLRVRWQVDVADELKSHLLIMMPDRGMPLNGF
jgi:hypothetical protein